MADFDSASTWMSARSTSTGSGPRREPLPQPVRLLDGVPEAASGIDELGGQCAPVGVAELGRDACPGVGLGHPAELDEAADPYLGGCVRDDDAVELPDAASVDERHVVDHDGARVLLERCPELLLRARDHRGMDDAVQPVPSRRVAEDDRTEGGAVEAPVLADHPRAERL